MAANRYKTSARLIHALLAAKQGHVHLAKQPPTKPAPTEFMPLEDERILLQLLPSLRPGTWQGLRCISRGTAEAVTNHLLKAAATRMMTVIPAGQNLCSVLKQFVHGATVVLAPGRHRWVGKLHANQIRIFGLPGANIQDRVQLAEGSSGSIYDVSFRSEDGCNIRLQDASWSLHGCTVECGDPDVAALTATSSKLALHHCIVMGIETATALRSCWMGLLAKGASSIFTNECIIGPLVQRGVVATDNAVVHVNGGRIQGCDEIGLRLSGDAHVVGQQVELINGGMALHVGASCTGSLELHESRIESFRTLCGGDFRTRIVDMQTTKVFNVGVTSD
mmetsp:Transcript_34397/g.67768  ORF Transcript_34397/g.67768 Transcript_34397/m.67768 type:complete len:335 (+) Transcript_34397:73-1077(+)|eukprot:CAMPEP_0172844152 /NCGR_PEP_ID=MMETSP1075-20121228/31998_1 /TAXON_ID=2916 /ORGANISM="Ceratium fusus, Strain PA161109" /LENGTH=334 /DNA_ID=CAMNT_0013688547 /DNA_START=76 /DNA_END=1080 /DNA_ORIENTATION=+